MGLYLTAIVSVQNVDNSRNVLGVGDVSHCYFMCSKCGQFNECLSNWGCISPLLYVFKMWTIQEMSYQLGMYFTAILCVQNVDSSRNVVAIGAVFRCYCMCSKCGQFKKCLSNWGCISPLFYLFKMWIIQGMS